MKQTMHNLGQSWPSAQCESWHTGGGTLLAPGKACLTLPAGHAGIAPGHAAPPGAASAAAPADEDEEDTDEPPEVKQFMQELGEGGGGRGSAGAGVPEEGAPTGAPPLAQSVKSGPQQPDRREGAGLMRCRGPKGGKGLLTLVEYMHQICTQSD